MHHAWRQVGTLLQVASAYACATSVMWMSLIIRAEQEECPSVLWVIGRTNWDGIAVSLVISSRWPMMLRGAGRVMKLLD